MNIFTKTVSKKQQNQGFTIIELMVAMAVFQIVLMITLVSYMQISKYYQKSINSARLQQIAGNVVDEISRSIQNTGGLVTSSDLFSAVDSPGGAQDRTNTKSVTTVGMATINGNVFSKLCVDSTRYFYRLGAIEPGDTLPNGSAAQLGDHAFLSETMVSPSACATDVSAAANYRIVLGQNMSLVRFGVAQNPATPSSYNIWLMAAYTSEVDDIDTTNIEPTDPTKQPTVDSYVGCIGGSNRQFCAATNISTTVVRRIGL